MAREKNSRTLHFKPIVHSFIPKNPEQNGMVKLLHEEIEAIYLMDVQGMYQEQAALSMEVSRPTFTRILKNARQKLAQGIISGYTIEIEDNKKDMIVAFFGNENTCSFNLKETSDFILIYQVNAINSILLQAIDNPLKEKNIKPAIVLPQILLENKVNIFVSSKIGEGLKNSLISKGIKSLVKTSISLNELYKL